MEFRPILSAMWRNRTGSILIALQIALTLAIVVNSLFLAKDRMEFIGRPTGMDVNNIINVTSLGFGSSYDHNQTVQDDLRILRELPGVLAATTASHFPLSGSGNGSGFRSSSDDDAPSQSANVYGFDEQAVSALGVTMKAGRGFLPTEIRKGDHEKNSELAPQAVVTQALADVLYPDEPALGKPVYNNLGQSATIVGIVDTMLGSWVHWDDVDKVIWTPQRNQGPAGRYIIRAKPGQRDGLIPLIEKTLSESNRNRLIRPLESMEEVVANSYELDNAMAIVLSSAVVMLLVVTGLGIVGLASFSVQQRTKQIGTRRAVGARKRDIIRYFLIENWLMTTIGIILGTILTIGVNYLLSSLFDMNRLNYVYLPIGMALLWLLGFIAVAQPARKASQVSPAIATRNV